LYKEGLVARIGGSVQGEEQQYTVKLRYIILNRKSIVEGLEVFQQLWTLKVVASALMCVWGVLLDRLPTTTNLFRIGIQLERYLCPLLKRVYKIVQHLFINCVVVKEV